MRNDEIERPDDTFSALFGALPVGALAEGPDRGVLAVNPRLIELFGLSTAATDLVGVDAAELIGRIAERCVDPEGFTDRAAELVAAREPVEGDEWDLRDGRTVERSYRPVDLPGGSGNLWLFRDVSATRRTVRELAESEERLSLALSAGQLGIWELDLGSNDSPVRSPRHDWIFGYEDPIDDWSVETFLEHVHPDDREDVRRRFDAAFETGRWEFDCRIHRADGERRWIEAQGEFHFDAEGTPTRAVGTVEDVTDERNSREELKRVNERLDQFSSMVSHDVRNPLSVALGRLERYYETGDESNLAPVETSLRRIEEIVTDLAALARYGSTGDEHGPVSLPDAARAAWAMIDTRSATLETEPVTLIGDESQLQGLFENLFRNAVGHGGPDVTVRVGPLPDGFYVEDTGDGIPSDHQDHVFEHGYTTGYGGSGIGLTIVDRIANAHGFDATVAESAEGGARFEFRETAPS
ncbi:PAS domain-containing protein [Halorubrum sp. JWXQ-INN 858]|uniref:PAS domain-containing sensor histidine kinase n=1 Tax=Halorubrum sp. JWXQ-INN 858 TaxID=2690782 RepID=UPI001356DD2A|nr:ATP-binding protein [Halorubrum sp. JWXQ-INN 858]MWV64352.1 PAS domain-containing protein [Halorubrum sp. JWXQ-INN 858]